MKIGSFNAEMAAHECIQLENSNSFFVKNTKNLNDIYVIRIWISSIERQYIQICKRTKDSSSVVCHVSLYFHQMKSRTFEIYEQNCYQFVDFYFPDGFQLSENWMRSVLEIELGVK